MQLSLQEIAMAYVFSKSAYLAASRLAPNRSGGYALYPRFYDAAAS